MNKYRQTELDVLRLLALLFVIALHVTSSVWAKLPIMSSEWIQTTVWRMTWPVPVFVMISGRFFLDPEKEISIKKIFGKYIKRLAVAFVFWSAIYQIYYAVQSYVQGGNPLAGWKGYIYEYCLGAYHMWYLYMLAGLYLLTPIIRKITTEKKILSYTILLAGIYHIIVYFGGEIPVAGELIHEIMGMLRLEFLSGFLVYYLLGYYLYRYNISKGAEIILYIAGATTLVGARIADCFLAVQQESVVEFFTNYMSPLTMIYSAAIYTLFVKRISKAVFSQKAAQFFSWTTKYGFGTYLIHALVLELIMLFPIFQVTYLAPVLWIPVIILAVTVISYGVTFILRKVPKIGKYIS